jgi:hypothetical protein
MSESAWPTLAAGTSTSLTVKFQNTGTATWQKGVAGQQANLGLNGDTLTFANLGMNDGWLSGNRLATTTEATVGPGQTGTFTFNVRAPMTPGTYRLPLRPVIDGVTWMEDSGVFMVIVSTSSYHSKWLSQSPYPTLRAGQTSGVLTVSYTILTRTLESKILRDRQAFVQLIAHLVGDDLTRTGAFVGLVAGGISATGYALHCTSDSLPFIALWYGGTIALCTLAGAALGPRLLRW